MNEKPEEKKSLDLSALDFGPSWARQGGNKPQRKQHRSGDEKHRDGARPKRRDGAGRPHKGDERRPFRGGQRGDERRRPQRPQPVEAPVGIAADVMPVEEGVDALSKEISATGRTYSVFDLARVILSARERFKVVFRKEEAGSEFYQNKFDGAVYLTKEECLSGLKAAEWFEKLYLKEEVAVEPPTGNFQSVAKCGLSGEILGPPNFHAYSQKLADLHRERFSHMDIAAYKSRVVTESGEEVVNAWLESMKVQQQYRAVGDEEVILSDWKALLAHFDEKHFAEVYRLTHRADVDSQIPGKLLSPGLLTLLKETIAEQRRYPGKLAPFLCRQLSGRHLAVFKWQGKLHTGPSRPHVIPEADTLADRPEALRKWVSEHPGAGVDELWKQLLPEDATDEHKKEWYHDLHWMINQGFIILLSDGHIFASSAAKVEVSKKPRSKSKSTPPAKAASEKGIESKPAKQSDPKEEA